MQKIRNICMGFPEVEESPHFHKSSFRVDKKIFATIDKDAKELVVKLSEIDQSVFTDMLSPAVVAVSGSWGKKGWTLVYCESVTEAILRDILLTAYKEVAPKRLRKT